MKLWNLFYNLFGIFATLCVSLFLWSVYGPLDALIKTAKWRTHPETCILISECGLIFLIFAIPVWYYRAQWKD